MGIADIRREKLGGGGTGSWPNKLRVTKYISKLNKIQITCHVFHDVFHSKYLPVFQLLDNSADKHVEQYLGFSHALPAAHAV